MNFKSKLTKIIALTLIAVIVLSITTPVASASGRWRQGSQGWWFQPRDRSHAVGWERIDGEWYYFDSRGWMQTGWVRDGGVWYYLRPSGAMATGWVRDGGYWYFLRPSGAMATGWVEDRGVWYWMHPSGAMATGTVTINGARHSFAESGRWLGGGGTGAGDGTATATGEGNWRQTSGGRWFELGDGRYATGWLRIEGAWYFFDSSGWMQTGWVSDGGYSYFLRPNGSMATGWLQVDNEYYYLRPSGAMATGFFTVGGTRHTFTSDGRWLAPNTSAISPLTGLPIPSNMANRRPLAISLNNNSAAALPMNGVSRADIIYEVPIEYNRTRLIGLFQDTSNLPTIGSIRSARYYIGEIAASHDAILLSFGRSFLAIEKIPDRGMTWINAHEGPQAHRRIINRNSERIPGRTVATEHNVVTSGTLINSHLHTYGFRLNHNAGWNNRLSFVDNATPSGGRAATNVNVRFSPVKTSAFSFDSSRGVYHMRQTINGSSSDFVDANNGARVEFTNLIILRTNIVAHYRDSAPPVEANRLRDIRTTGSGYGYFVNGGRVVDIRWSRADLSSPFVYTLSSNGAPLNLGRGTTYVGIVPINNNVNFS